MDYTLVIPKRRNYGSKKFFKKVIDAFDREFRFHY